jgi:hypothetical protein
MDRIKRLKAKENRLVTKGYKTVDEGRNKKADRILGRAAKVENRIIKVEENKIKKKLPKGKKGVAVKFKTRKIMAKTAAWTRKEGKDPKGGLNAKGVASYRAANPGSKLQTAVTTKPSKLKAGSKDAKRRKSFCARMSGMPGPAKKPNGEPTRKTLALRKWNC